MVKTVLSAVILVAIFLCITMAVGAIVMFPLSAFCVIDVTATKCLAAGVLVIVLHMVLRS